MRAASVTKSNVLTLTLTLSLTLTLNLNPTIHKLQARITYHILPFATKGHVGLGVDCRMGPPLIPCRNRGLSYAKNEKMYMQKPEFCAFWVGEDYC